MGNSPVSGMDPDGGWVKGAGLWNNLFKSDDRIYSEQNAEKWGSSIINNMGGTSVTHSAFKEGGVWGVRSITTNGEEHTITVSFTPFDSNGNFGTTVSDVGYWSPVATGQVDFDPLGQLTFTPTGGAIVGIPLSIGIGMARNVLIRSTSALAIRTSSSILNFAAKQLQSKFKHAADFGVAGNYSRANAANFSSAINQHINALGTEVIHGTYRNANNPVVFYLNRTTGLNVIATPSGQFISGARLTAPQVNDILTKGFLW
jgi:hypothetical protein